MLRKSMLALAAIVAAAPFVLSVPAGAKPFGPKIINGPKYFPKPYPHPYPFPKPHQPHWYPHHKVIIVQQPVVRPIVQPIVQQPVRPVVRPVAVAAPKVTNCLTKEYTPEGLLIFRDLCTKEMASTPIPGTPAAAAAIQQQANPQAVAPANGATPQSSVSVSEAPAPDNFAGKSYEEFKAAQPQASAPAGVSTDGTAKN